MKKEIEIDKKIEQEVEAMFLIGVQAQKINSEYPKCWEKITEQFGIVRFISDKKEPDNIDNFKLNLYVEILRKQKENEDYKKKIILKKLN